MIEAVIGLAGVVVGSAITISKDVWVSRLERRREGSYSAIRLICILEEYVDKCISVVGDDGTVYGQPAGRTSDGEEYYKPTEPSPPPLEFPDDIAWRSLKEPVMHRILALPNTARSTNRHISGAWEHSSPPHHDLMFAIRHEGYARLGLEALEIAENLRQQFGVSANGRVKLNSNWEPKKYLLEELAKFDERRSEFRRTTNEI